MTRKEREAACKARIADEFRRLQLRPWECSPSQVHGYANPYRPGDGAFDGWIKAEKMVAEILAADPEYFTRSPTDAQE